MNVFVLNSYNDGPQAVFKTLEGAITDAQKTVESWDEPMDDWAMYFTIDEVEFVDETE